jgi:hypothetical protein
MFRRKPELLKEFDLHFGIQCARFKAAYESDLPCRWTCGLQRQFPVDGPAIVALQFLPRLLPSLFVGFLPGKPMDALDRPRRTSAEGVSS